MDFDKAFSLSLLVASSVDEVVIESFMEQPNTQSCLDTFKNLSRYDQQQAAAKMLDGVQEALAKLCEAERAFIEFLKD